MTFEEWLKTVPREFTDDPLWKMEVYRLAFLASDLAWHDVTTLLKDKRTISLSDQLYRAVGSIKANIAEGYSHRSKIKHVSMNTRWVLRVKRAAGTTMVATF